MNPDRSEAVSGKRYYATDARHPDRDNSIKATSLENGPAHIDDIVVTGTIPRTTSNLCSELWNRIGSYAIFFLGDISFSLTPRWDGLAEDVMDTELQLRQATGLFQIHPVYF